MGSTLAARETDPTPVVTRSSDVRRAESTSSMVLGSRTRGGRSSAAILDVEVRPDIEFRQDPEIDNPAEIQVSVSAICDGSSGATRMHIPETAANPLGQPVKVSEYVTVDRLYQGC